MLTPFRVIATIAIVMLATLPRNSTHLSKTISGCGGLHAGIMARVEVGSPHTTDGTRYVVLTFTVLNDGDTTASPERDDWKLFVDDIEVGNSQTIFLEGEGPVGGWRDLKAGESFHVKKRLPVALYFPEEREHKVYWESRSFRSSTIVVNANL